MKNERLFDFNTPFSYLKALIQESGKIFGRLIILLLDVILGGMVLSRLLSDYSIPIGFNLEISGISLAWLFSFGLWYVQIKLWDKVLEDGIDWNEDWFNIVLAVIVAIGDTIIDSSVVQIWESRELHSILSTKHFFGFPMNTYDLLINALLLLVIILTGFGEYLDRTSNDRVSKPLSSRKTNFRANRRKSVPNKPFTPYKNTTTPKKSKNPENPRWLENLSDKVPMDIPTSFLEKYKNV